MKIQILVILTVMFFSGCERCETHCEDDVIHYCYNDGGGGIFGSSVNEWEENCEPFGMTCFEKLNTAYCGFPTDKCGYPIESFCINEKVANCFMFVDNVFYANYGDTCNSSDNHKCMEFGNEAKCVYHVEECNSNADKVCMGNVPVKCYEKEGEFFLETGYYNECYGNEKCVETNNTALCLKQVEACDPNIESICYQNSVANCYEKDGSYYIDEKEYCGYKDCVFDSSTQRAKCSTSYD